MLGSELDLQLGLDSIVGVRSRRAWRGILPRICSNTTFQPVWRTRVPSHSPQADPSEKQGVKKRGKKKEEGRLVSLFSE